MFQIVLRDSRRLKFSGLILGLASGLTACGGGGSSDSGSPAPPPPVAQADATRFLEQATFGPTTADIALVQSEGFEAWLKTQFGTPKTGYTGFSYVPHTALPDCTSDPANPTSTASLCARDSYSPFQVQRQFFANAMTGPDQLRQRVAFAWSQIFVISATDVYEAYGMAGFQNLLLDDAFVNFRQLMNDVTLSPGMGRYLDMVNNDKANAAIGTSPNENYARELMQLFSIGVDELNPDGSAQTDATGAPIPTYPQAVIDGYSDLFTGWTYAPLTGASAAWNAPVNYSAPMVLIAAHHDTTAKTLLNGTVTAAGQTGDSDLQAGLDLIFNHPNVGPFIATRLIQHLVTSNPSPAYVARIASVFADDGNGTRGDIQAVVQAILLDTEARGDQQTGADYGHLREPALFVTAFMRSVGGQSDGVYLRSQSSAMGQAVFDAGSVFNFYPPDYSIPGYTELGPEFAIQGTATALARINFVNQVVLGGGAAADPTVTGSTGTTIDLSYWTNSSANPQALVTALDQRLTHGTLSTAANAAIVTAINAATSGNLVPTAVYLFGVSPQYQVER